MADQDFQDIIASDSDDDGFPGFDPIDVENGELVEITLDNVEL